MTTMWTYNRRTRFGKLLIGTWFIWQDKVYCKIDNEHAQGKQFTNGGKFVFAEKALVYKVHFTAD